MLVRVPTFPKLLDLARRSHIPENLGAIASIGAEMDPAEVGLARGYAERIRQHMRLLYRSAVRPAIPVPAPDLTRGTNLRSGCGRMPGGRAFDLLSPETRRAFVYLGFAENVAWTEPERALSCAVLTSGEPILCLRVTRAFGLGHAITSETARVAETDLAF
ncbi:hypothetical protein [Nocardia abscessus]|uniref:Uncharacterized protein n=1 Tax=Nocardia abscessus TaxID=120957 RepID=A0ABS0CKY2_9NOCA|nr:hypothetical protein [Nocardia abscessus]MBF6229093.1 hypothetical protein [Nocardia abscessus]